MKFLVTGGAGFIGSHLIRILIKNYHHVVILDNLSSGYEANIPTSHLIHFIQGDIRDKKAVTEAMRGCDYVVHLAALVSVTRSMQNPSESKSNNIDGLFTVLEAARLNGGIKKFMLASSAAVYGNPAEVPLKESTALKPISPYGLEKMIGELYLALYSEVYGLPTISPRFFNVYGERQDDSSPYSGVVSLFANRRMKKQQVTIYGDGQQTRDFIYAGDLAANLYGLLLNDVQGAINLGTGKGTTVRKLIDTFDEILPLMKAGIKYLPAREGDIRTSIANVETLQNAKIGVSPVSLRIGLQQLLAAKRVESVKQINVSTQLISQFATILQHQISKCLLLNIACAGLWLGFEKDMQASEPKDTLILSARFSLNLLLLCVAYYWGAQANQNANNEYREQVSNGRGL